MTWKPEDSFPYFTVARRWPEYDYAAVLREVEWFETSPEQLLVFLQPCARGSFVSDVAVAFDREQKRREGVS